MLMKVGMAIKHKEIKRCQMIMNSMSKAHNIPPGTLLVLKEPGYFTNYDVDANADKVTTTEAKFFNSKIIGKNEVIMFVDVVYDPRMRNHMLRFLHEEKMVAITFKKGKTIKELRTSYDKFCSQQTKNDQ